MAIQPSPVSASVILDTWYSEPRARSNRCLRLRCRCLLPPPGLLSLAIQPSPLSVPAILTNVIKKHTLALPLPVAALLVVAPLLMLTYNAIQPSPVSASVILDTWYSEPRAHSIRCLRLRCRYLPLPNACFHWQSNLRLCPCDTDPCDQKTHARPTLTCGCAVVACPPPHAWLQWRSNRRLCQPL